MLQQSRIGSSGAVQNMAPAFRTFCQYAGDSDGSRENFRFESLYRIDLRDFTDQLNAVPVTGSSIRPHKEIRIFWAWQP